MELGFNEMKQLTQLFNPPKDNSDSEDDQQDSCEDQTNIIGPSGDKKEENKKKKVNPYSKIEGKDATGGEMLDEEGFLAEEETKTDKDWKKTPVWDITYKQKVTAEDVFLQMGFKTPSTSSCEDMVVAINLPGDNRYNMDLKILKDNLVLVTPRHYLDLKLPHPVDPQKGNAQFDNEAEKLVVTLRMDRELDLINF